MFSAVRTTFVATVEAVDVCDVHQICFSLRQRRVDFLRTFVGKRTGRRGVADRDESIGCVVATTTALHGDIVHRGQNENRTKWSASTICS